MAHSPIALFKIALLSDLNQIVQPFSASVLTIGNFDGIHLGHQGLFQKVRERAQAIQGTLDGDYLYPPSGPGSVPPRPPARSWPMKTRSSLFSDTGSKWSCPCPFKEVRSITG